MASYHPETRQAAADDAQARISHYWTRHAPTYEAHQANQLQHAAIHRAWMSVWRHALPPAPLAVLDSGTGTGHAALSLAELGHHVTGIDLAAGMLTVARTKTQHLANPSTFLPGDAVNPPFPAHSFTALTSRYLLWTLRQPQTALRHWRELLQPGGTLAIVDSTWFPEGIHTEPLPPSDTKLADFRHLYNQRVLAVLPLAQARTMQPAVTTVAAAGFLNIRTLPLDEIFDLDHRYGVAPAHQPRLQYLITATAP